ncbi:MAG: hypothetical protein K0R57_2360 [Paenibacillaceae bacterium]|nr:hypothetical protein [Paenibacillaceae bacterium]
MKNSIVPAAALAVLLLFPAGALADEGNGGADPHAHHSVAGTPSPQPAASLKPAPTAGLASPSAAEHNMTEQEHQNMAATPTASDHHMTEDEHGHMSPAPGAAATAGASSTASTEESGDTYGDDGHSSHDDGNDGHSPEEAPAAGGHSHGSTENLVETPANVPVLSSFAAVNGAFLLVGLRNKLVKRKGREHHE